MKRRLTAPAASLACANSGCTNTIERRSKGRQKRFCSDNCRIRAHRISLQAAPNLVPGDTALAPDHSNAPGGFPAKKGHFVTSKINALQSLHNRGSAIYRGGIQGPKSAVKVELIDARKWTEVISSKSVKSFVSPITKSALRGGGTA
jgi:hypothetical protein